MISDFGLDDKFFQALIQSTELDQRNCYEEKFRGYICTNRCQISIRYRKRIKGFAVLLVGQIVGRLGCIRRVDFPSDIALQGLTRSNHL